MAVVPDTKNSIVVTKQFTYRGATRKFTNRYHFEGALPADPTAWTTFCDNVVTAEKAIYHDAVEILQVDGYDASSATTTNPHGDAVFTKTYTTHGTGDFTTDGFTAPGDCAIFVRYGTTARSAKNHPVYLSNYYHGVYRSTDDADLVAASQKTAVETYADAWVTGFTDGTGPRERCGPRGAVAVTKSVSPYVRHRDFPA